MSAKVTNVGMLDWQHSNGSAIRWLNGDEEIIFAHGLWINGMMNDTLIGTTPLWIADYSEGPIIDGQAATLIQPEDSSMYRVYHIDQSSNIGDPDYDDWPVQWGAPHYSDGSPLVIGDQTTFMVYNDAHPGEDYRGWPYSGPTYLEIHETIWDYGISPGFENVLFFRYQIYNRGNYDILDAAISLWLDVDLYDATWNLGGYNPNGNFMYNYFSGIETGILPRACTYMMLQGPVVPDPDSTAIFFGHIVPDSRNLQTTSGMYVLSDSYPESDTLMYLPNTMEELRFISLGLMVNGVIGAALTVPASGLLGLDEERKWRWSAAVAGAGGGLALIGIIWVASLARVSDLNVVTGAGAFLTMFAGAILAVTSKSILTEFRRNKTYDDVEVAAA